MEEEKTPKISVCVITYNHGKWLQECLQSIVTQVTDFPFEVIVGDDCSTDGITREILRKYAEKYPNLIVPLFRDVNMGGGGTQNWLDVMRRARGEYIAHIDGDDRMLPGKLQKQTDFLDQHPDCAMVGHDLRIFDGETGNTIHDNFTKLNIPEITDINFLLLNGSFFGHSSKMYRRSAIITQYRDKPTADYFLHVEHASKGKIGYINEVLGEYRRSLGTASDYSMLPHRNVDDAFDRALELGSDPAVVAKGRLLFNLSAAYIALYFNDCGGFKKFIHLEQSDFQYATWRHHLLYRLRFCSSLFLLIIKLIRGCSSLLIQIRSLVGKLWSSKSISS